MEGMPQWIRGVTSRQAHVNLPPGAAAELLVIERASVLAVDQDRSPPTTSRCGIRNET